MSAKYFGIHVLQAHRAKLWTNHIMFSLRILFQNQNIIYLWEAKLQTLLHKTIFRTSSNVGSSKSSISRAINYAILGTVVIKIESFLLTKCFCFPKRFHISPFLTTESKNLNTQLILVPRWIIKKFPSNTGEKIRASITISLKNLPRGTSPRLSTPAPPKHSETNLFENYYSPALEAALHPSLPLGIQTAIMKKKPPAIGRKSFEPCAHNLPWNRLLQQLQ